MQLADNAALGASLRAMLKQLAEVNYWLDSDMTDEYRAQPLAHRIMRTTKVCEEAGEVWRALSAATGENPRKGVCGTDDDVNRELADICSAALCAIQHRTGDVAATWAFLVEAFAVAHSRIGMRPEPIAKVTEAQLRDALRTSRVSSHCGATTCPTCDASARGEAAQVFAALTGNSQ